MFSKDIPFHILVFILAAIAADGQTLDYKYYEKAEGWFKLHTVPENWAKAKQQCENEDAVLASPMNTMFLKTMQEVMGDQVHSGLYTGIYATFCKPDYFTAEGIPLSDVPVSWAPNEPDNFVESEACLTMFANGTMADVKCTEVFPYICYKKAVSCGTNDSEYQLEKRTGSCYKFHRVGRPWPEAAKTCASEGGYLAIINTDVESEVLKEIYAKFPNSAIISPEPINWSLFVGFQNWGLLDSWLTIHGETLKEAGFDKWNPGEPNSKDEHCGSILRTGLLNDVTCTLYLPFICEKFPSATNCKTSEGVTSVDHNDNLLGN